MKQKRFNEVCPFKKNVEVMRTALHLTVDQLCRKVGTSRQTHDSTMRLNSPGWKTLVKYAKALGVTPTDLIKE